MSGYTIVAGSFTVLHSGHKNLLKAAALSGNPVIVGLTTDRYVKEHKGYRGRSYSSREKAISAYLSNFSIDFEIRPLDEQMGNSASNEQYSTIVVSPETEPVAHRINRERSNSGLKPLSILKVPYTLAEDLFPVNSTRIIEGEITPKGLRKRPVRVGIATANRLKVESAEKVLRKVMKRISMEVVTEYSLGSEQPMGRETVALAIKRAQAALGDRDYGLGIESGLYREPITSRVFDFHVCAIVDRYSRISTGFGSGFSVPGWIVDAVREGITESMAFQREKGTAEIGQKEGIAGFVSSNMIKRSILIEESVRNAVAPRKNPEFVSSYTQNY
ncbi:MAG: pantetheine-phosphate adenylyltransferase [Thermoplasmataceae archaeon]